LRKERKSFKSSKAAKAKKRQKSEKRTGKKLFIKVVTAVTSCFPATEMPLKAPPRYFE
jgi:hypothetical protein